jgi:hypothetical protein
MLSNRGFNRAPQLLCILDRRLAGKAGTHNRKRLL